MPQQSPTPTPVVGRLTGLARYPVKSALGQSLTTVDLAETGLTGDRGLAVVDVASGRVASAKHPRLWRALLTATASLPTEDAAPTVDQLEVRLGDGSVWSGTGPHLDAALSRLLGRTVQLTATPPAIAVLDRADPGQVFASGLDAAVDVEALTMGQASPPGTFVDYAPIHLITSSTVDRIAALAGHRIDPGRYRPNIVIETAPGDAGFVENDWVGRTLGIGDSAQLRIVMATPRCAVPTLDHGRGRDVDAVRPLAEHNRLDLDGFGWQPCAGVYAQVVTPGALAVGDSVRILA